MLEELGGVPPVLQQRRHFSYVAKRYRREWTEPRLSLFSNSVRQFPELLNQNDRVLMLMLPVAMCRCLIQFSSRIPKAAKKTLLELEARLILRRRVS